MLKQDEKIDKLIDVLYECVFKDKLKWKSIIDDDDDVFQTSFPDSSIRIARKGYDDYWYILRIYNEKGMEIVERIVNDSASEFYEKMQSIFENARYKALEVDKALDKLILQLTV